MIQDSIAKIGQLRMTNKIPSVDPRLYTVHQFPKVWTVVDLFPILSCFLPTALHTFPEIHQIFKERTNSMIIEQFYCMCYAGKNAKKSSHHAFQSITRPFASVGHEP